MYCIQCGREIPDEAKFCNYCGTPVIDAEKQNKEKQQKQGSEARPENVTRQQIQKEPTGGSVSQTGDLSAVRKYIFPRGKYLFFAAIYLVGAIYMFMSPGISDKTSVLAIFGGAAVLFCLPLLMGILGMNKKMKKLKTSGMDKECALDFANSRKALKERLHVGKQWLYGKGTGNIVRYDEITQIYRSRGRAMFITVYHNLVVRLQDGGTITICKLPSFFSDEELQEVFKYIYGKNPSVKFGYK